MRDIVSSQEYQRLFETSLRPDSTAVNRWQTTARGVYVSVGVGGPITGRGAHLAIIDDPVKNQEDAESEIIRERVWNWYLTTLKTRLMPGGAIILMMTRWHEQDLAGRIVQEEGDEWEVLKFPAVNDQGEALWPEWFGIDELATHRKHHRTWQALYQQNPMPETGVYFDRPSIQRYTLGSQPTDLHRYITTDFAVTQAGGDYTVFGDWGVDVAGHWWLLDIYREQSTAAKWVDVLVKWVKDKKPLKVFGEGGVIRRAIEDFMKKSMRDRQAYTRVEWINRHRDKVAMAAGFRGLLEQGLIHIPLTEWGEGLVAELMKFPAGEHDDQVDMCSLLGLAVTQGIAATTPVETTTEVQSEAYGTIESQDKDWMLA